MKPSREQKDAWEADGARRMREEIRQRLDLERQAERRERTAYANGLTEGSHTSSAKKTVAATLAIGAIVVALILALAIVMSQPVTIGAHCQIQDWKKLPDGLTWGGDIEMAPQNADCSVQVQAPLWAVLGAKH